MGLRFAMAFNVKSRCAAGEYASQKVEAKLAERTHRLAQSLWHWHGGTEKICPCHVARSDRCDQTLRHVGAMDVTMCGVNENCRSSTTALSGRASRHKGFKNKTLDTPPWMEGSGCGINVGTFASWL